MKRGWFDPYLKKLDCFAKRLGLIFISVPQRCLVAGRITEQSLVKVRSVFSLLSCCRKRAIFKLSRYILVVMGETHVREVVSSNPCPKYFMDHSSQL